MSVTTEQENTHGPVDVIDQPRHDKQSWLAGPGDLDEVEVDVEAIGDSVVVRSLTAGQLARIQDECMNMKGDTVKVDSLRMGVLKFARGVIEPQFSEEEANVIAHKYGASFNLVVEVVDEISKAGEGDVAKARRRFRPRR